MKRLLLFLWLLWLTIPATAEITATVTPGYQFMTGERPTVTTLNLLGTPTITITGTLGGTNVSLGAGTVSGTMLMDSVAGSNLTWNSDSPRGLEINTTAAGLGLGGGGGYALSNKTDNITITITNDTLTLLSAPPNHVVISNGYLLGGKTGNTGTNIGLGDGLNIGTNVLYLELFTSSELEFTNNLSGLFASVNHGLSVVPTIVRWVYVCKTNHNDWVAGDEVDIQGTMDTDAAPAFNTGANSTAVWLVKRSGSTARLFNKTTGAAFSVDSNWKLKVYCRP